MARWHLFEIEDQPWCPPVLRDGCTAYITHFVEMMGMLDGALPLLQKLVDASEERRIIDLCSGAGGPARLMVRALADQGTDVQVHCTDLYPNQLALADSERRAAGHLTFSTESVDAAQVPPALKGPRTIFNAFHHFRPELGRKILVDAVESGQPIGIFEFVGRQPHTIVGLMGVPFAVMALLPWLRPFRWGWVPLTYVVPLLPLMVQWDGLVSCLRTYSPNELRGLVDGLDSYDWDIGEFPLPVPGTGTYLVGTPKPSPSLVVAS